MSKRYEFNITQTQEFIVGIEAEDEWEAREIFDELNSDDFGDPVNSVLEIKYVSELEQLNWKKKGNVWSGGLSYPTVSIELKGAYGYEEYWLHIFWNQYTRLNARYWSLSEAKAAAERKVRNLRVAPQEIKNG